MDAQENTVVVEKKVKARFPFWKRLLIFLLGLLVGLIACLGGIAGAGFWAFKNLSVDKLQEMGLIGELPEAMQGTGDVDITAYTLGDLITEVGYYTSSKDNLTLNQMQKRYGLKLFADVKEILPEKLGDYPFSHLGTENGLDELLACVDMGYILSKVPEGTLSPALIDTLKDKNLANLKKDGVGALLNDVYLGYLLHVNYEKQGDAWVLVPENPEKLTASELLSALNMGKLMEESKKPDGDTLKVVREELGDISVGDLMGAKDTPVGDILLEDAIVMGENGKYKFSLEDSFAEISFGELMGYTLGTDGSWTDKEGNPIKGIESNLAPMTVKDFMDGKISMDTVVGEDKLGDLMGYTLEADGAWYKDGVKITGIEESLANISAKEALSGNLDFASVLNDVYLGEVMGYTPVEWNSMKEPIAWETKDGKPVTGINETVANMKTGALTDGSFDFEDAFGNQTVGELQGYTFDGDKWYEDAECKKPLSTVNNAIAKLLVSDLINGRVDFSKVFEDEKLGDLMGYTKKAGAWFKKVGTKEVQVTGVESIAASWSLKALMNGTLDMNKEVEKLTLADVMGYKKNGKGQWTDSKGNPLSNIFSLLAETRLTDMDTRVSNWYLGDVMGYKQVGGKWQDNGKAVTGIMLPIADLKLSDISNSDLVKDALQGMTVSDVMGYTVKDGKYYDGAVLVTGAMAYLASSSVGTLSSRIETMKVSDVLGMEKKGSTWYLDGKPATNLVQALASTPVNSLNTAMNDLKLQEVFQGTENGFLSILGGNTKLSELDSKIESIFDPSTGATIGSFMDAGLIKNVDAKQDQNLKKLLKDDAWRDTPITGFVNKIIGAIGSLPMIP